MANKVLQGEERRKLFGRWVADRRHDRQMTQVDAAKKAGMTRQQWNRIEGGNGTKYDTVVRIADALNFPAAIALVKAGFTPVDADRSSLSPFPPPDTTELRGAISKVYEALDKLPMEVRKDRDAHPIVKFGTVAAGTPIDIYSEGEPFEVDAFITAPGSPNFAVTVEGESMIDDGVRPGDVLVCHLMKDYRHIKRDMRVIVDLESTGPTYKRWGTLIRDRLTLLPSNNKKPDALRYSVSQVRGVYKVTGLIRKMK